MVPCLTLIRISTLMGVENWEYCLKVSITVLRLGSKSEKEVLNSIRVLPITANTVNITHSPMYCQRQRIRNRAAFSPTAIELSLPNGGGPGQQQSVGPERHRRRYPVESDRD